LREQRDSVYRVINEYREARGLTSLKRSRYLEFWSGLYTWQVHNINKKQRHSKALRYNTTEIICFAGVDCLGSWSRSLPHNMALMATGTRKIGVGISHGVIVARMR
jgi:hypothetical protein